MKAPYEDAKIQKAKILWRFSFFKLLNLFAF